MIELFRAPSGWMARHTGEDRALVVDLFGTDTLPTAFTAYADADVVVESITLLNPESQVVIKEA